MIGPMPKRSVVAAALLAASLSSLAAAARLYLWPGAQVPLLLPAPAAPPATEPNLVYPVTTRSVEVRPGDTLVQALGRAGVGARAAAELSTLFTRNGVELKKLRPGNALGAPWSHGGEPIEVRYAPSAWVRFSAVRWGRSWAITRAETRPDVRVEAVRGEVRRSLFEAIDALGESPQLVVAMVEIFESDFDFTADTRVGDRFRLLVEKRYAGEGFVNYGRILVAQYVSAGRVLSGVGWVPERPGRDAFYDLDGRSLKKSFLKSPLEFTRITSGFTYARPHPILGGVRPHLAIDYAAPVGTPVRAVADGTIVRAGWNEGNGIQVHLRHRSGYETIYNHLSSVARGLRAGVRVSQRQVIGYVGATGLATGPHLDYRIAKGGTFVNPLSEKFIPGEPISAAEKSAFLRESRALVERLETEAPF